MILTKASAPAPPLGNNRHRLPIEWACTLLFVFAIYRVSPIITSGDSHFVVPTALSILRHGDSNIDDYRAQFSEAQWAVRWSRGHFYNVYPIGVALMALPVVFVWDRAQAFRGIDLEASAIARPPLALELTLASLFTAGSASLLFCYCRERLTLVRSLLLTFLFAFGTSAYSSASRGMWQHGPSMLLLLAAILVFYRLATRHLWGCVLVGLLAGFSFSVRPSNLLVAVAFAVLVGVRKLRWLLPYLIGAILGIVPAIVVHLAVYGTILSPYYRMTIGAAAAPFHLAPLLALLFSPSRGLFIFSPFAAFVLARLWPSALREHPLSMLEIALGVLALAWIFGTAKWPEWWGGGSFGPRLLCELLPCLMILLIPVVEKMSLEAGKSNRILATGFLILGIVSVAIHLRGATSEDVWKWNGTPVSVDSAPSRVWSWRDVQFLRGLHNAGL